MTRWTRRQLGRLAGGLTIASLASGAAPALLGQARPRVVVIGGGAGGATAARYLANAPTPIDVTLIEANPIYNTCFFSNLCIAGLRPFDRLEQTYDTLRSRYGVSVIFDRAIGVDTSARRVRLGSGVDIPYDRLVLSPGIDFHHAAIAGYDEATALAMPHAWRGGEQAQLLRRQLEEMPDGGLFVIVAPANPFRCPPGPYERASLIAEYFTREKPRSKILILDAKNSFAKQELFLEAWSRRFPGMIEWLPADFTGGISGVHAEERAVVTAAETFRPAVANVIPPQTAGRIALELGLAGDNGWCPVDPATLASPLIENVHVIGDAIIPGDMPKSAFAANSQAKVCAMSIAADLVGGRRLEPLFLNTCWSFVAADEAIRIGASYRVRDGKIAVEQTFISALGETAQTREKTAHEAEAWYAACTVDIFG